MRATLKTVHTEIQNLNRNVSGLIGLLERRFEKLDERFSKIDERFSKIDERFSKIDERFSKVDECFDQVDKRFSKIDERFDQVDERFSKIDNRLATMKYEITDEVVNGMWPYYRYIEKTLGNHGQRLTALETNSPPKGDA